MGTKMVVQVFDIEDGDEYDDDGGGGGGGGDGGGDGDYGNDDMMHGWR